MVSLPWLSASRVGIREVFDTNEPLPVSTLSLWASRSQWQDVLCDGLVDMPSATAAAA